MKIALVCSHGGHLSEIMELADAYSGHDAFFITYDAPRTRVLAERKYLLRNIGFNPFLMAIAAAQIMLILLWERPHIILSTGAEIAIPAFYIGRLLSARTIYVETVARVVTPSLTGRWVYPVTNAFFVQWPDLLACYGPKAQHKGGML